MMINNPQALVRFRLLFCGCDLMKIGPSPRSDSSLHRTEAWCAEFDSIMSLFLSTGEGKKKGRKRDRPAGEAWCALLDRRQAWHWPETRPWCVARSTLTWP
jgi:hypothetical protein